MLSVHQRLISARAMTKELFPFKSVKTDMSAKVNPRRMKGEKVVDRSACCVVFFLRLWGVVSRQIASLHRRKRLQW